MNAKEQATQLLSTVGVQIGGSQPWDFQVHDERLYDRVFASGILGLAESYMDGWWDVEALDQFFFKALDGRIDQNLKITASTVWMFIKAVITNRQSRSRAAQVGEQHYDVGNDLYRAMLDKRLVYSCSYWKDAKNLDEAQEAKLDLICRKLNLRKGQRVLDIGCGWGSFLKYAYEKYGVEGVGITISKEQAALAREMCQGMPIEIRLQDYREVQEKFDAIVSVGMFEHVGYKNYRTYMEVAARCLAEDGLFLLHTIGGNFSTTTTDPFVDKYIFPNGMIPSVAQIGRASERLFVVEDWHNFGSHYDKTLMAWLANFDAAWPQLQHAYSERFHRMWRYYLAGSAANFRARSMHLWQIVLSRHGVPGGYESVR